MRLMLVGTLQGYITEAGKLAMAKGAKVAHAEDIDMALEALRTGKGADLVMVDVKQDIAAFIKQLKAERIVVPVVAFGLGDNKEVAVRAIRAGAQEYLPLPPNAELIAAVLSAVTQESETIIAADPKTKAAFDMAAQVAPSEATIMIPGEVRLRQGSDGEVRAPQEQARRRPVHCRELRGHPRGAAGVRTVRA